MYPTQHAAAAIGTATHLAQRGVSRTALALFAASAVLVDVDHYFSYVWETGDLSLRRAYEYHHASAARSRWGLRLHLPALVLDRRRPFHSVAAIALLCLAARRWPLLLPVALGVVFHRVQDFCWETIRVPLRHGQHGHTEPSP